MAIADTTSRYLSNRTTSASMLRRADAEDDDTLGKRLDELIDRAIHGGLLTGPDWDHLTHLLSRRPTVILSPQSIWADLAERLLHEMAIADGVCWMHRAEAYHRLMAHPTGGAAAIAATVSTAADRSVQSMVGLVSILDSTAHPTAGQQVIRHLRDPVSDRTFYGALLACVRKVRFGHFDAKHLRTIVSVLTDVLTDDRITAVSGLAASVLRIVPATVRKQVSHRVWRKVADNTQTPSVRDYIVERLSNAAVAQLQWTVDGFEDQILPQLMTETLFGSVLDERLHAQFMLYSTPYRQPVARVLGNELTYWRARDHGWTMSLLEALRVLGGPEERRQVELLLLGGGVPAEVRDTAASALAHIGGSSTDTYWRSAFQVAVARWQATRAAQEVSVLDRIVYALGIADNLGILRQVTTNPAIPDRVRRSARWWLSLPNHVRVSARH